HSAAGGSLESTLNRKLQNVTNTMDSIQGLSTWCIDNKKYHSVIVRHWIKCLRKSDASHRLNLLYLANDVIQNCKRKNAIVYRTAFAEVLPDAFHSNRAARRTDHASYSCFCGSSGKCGHG
uniref:Regulation of nuclear pre-mRNA domain-containing protein 2 n=1 Tax=Amphilophus citrinellus TaxID=61819 RepID=A0A3Q0RP38_AMPCI